MAGRNDGLGNDRLEHETDTVTLAVRADELSRAAAWLEAIADRDDWPQNAAFALQISLEEALANVILHGFPEEQAGKGSITLGYGLSAGMAWLRITDNGIPFDPTSQVEPPVPDSIESAEIGGHGIRIIRRMLDDFSYCQTNGNNQLILGRRLSKDDE